MTLPSFTYHPDPVATGAVVASDATCECCDRVRGYVYTGPIYAEDDVETLCPWCIADGSATARFDADFTDVDGDLADEALDEIAKRTPGFSAWQQERWLCHCGDGAEFHGRVGAAELAAHPDALADIRAEGWPDDFLPALSAKGPPTAYLFRCRRCRVYLAYSDTT